MQDAPDIAQFRETMSQFIQAHLPADVRDTMRSGRALSREQAIAWNQILARAGLLVPHWPQRWGGCAWTVEQQLAFEEELCTHDAPELSSITFSMIAPVLIRYGNDAQRERFLPKIAAGTQWWCQGYSEPNSGSDLASLRTRAERQGDHYRVSGSKIWTSYAHYADWMFCLVRTDPKARAQEGISFLLIDMKSPGVTVRPIVGIHGWNVFTEVFLDDVAVPLENLVGQENQGWTIAKSLLEFERLKLARIGENKRRRARALEVAQRRDALGQRIADQHGFRRRFAELDARLLALEANAARFIAAAKAEVPVGGDVGMLKLRGSQLIQAWEALIVDALNEYTLVLDPGVLRAGAPSAGKELDKLAATASSRRFLSRGYTLAGGTSEIQHNILAKGLLQS